MIEAEAGEVTLTRDVTLDKDLGDEIRLGPMMRAAALLVAPHLLALGSSARGLYRYAVALPGGPALLELAIARFTGPTVSIRASSDLEEAANRFLDQFAAKVKELCPQGAASFRDSRDAPDLPF
jgi:hypothetical protein